MNYELYKKSVKHNTRVLNKLLKKRSTDVSDIIFYEGVRGDSLSFDVAAHKLFDVLGCCAIGALPSIRKTGTDGFIWFEDENAPHELEVKVSGIDPELICLGSKGGLYWSSDPTNPENRTSIKSHFEGKFETNMRHATFQSKKRLTSLICFDRTQNAVIDAWLLSPDSTLEQLHNRKDNKTMTLKLSCFEKSGTKITPTIKHIGWDKWVGQQTAQAMKNSRFVCSRPKKKKVNN